MSEPAFIVVSSDRFFPNTLYFKSILRLITTGSSCVKNYTKQTEEVTTQDKTKYNVARLTVPLRKWTFHIAWTTCLNRKLDVTVVYGKFNSTIKASVCVIYLTPSPPTSSPPPQLITSAWFSPLGEIILSRLTLLRVYRPRVYFFARSSSHVFGLCSRIPWRLDCSVSYFLWSSIIRTKACALLWETVFFDRTAAILFCNGERNLQV